MLELRPDIRSQLDENAKPVVVDWTGPTRASLDPFVVEMLRCLDRAESLDQAWARMEAAGLAAEVDRESFDEFFESAVSPYFLSEELLAWQAHQREQGRAARLDGLAAAIEYASTKVPYYRQLRGATDWRIREAGDLQRLPLLTRAELRTHFPTALLAEGPNYAALIASDVASVGYTTSPMNRAPYFLSEADAEVELPITVFKNGERGAIFKPPCPTSTAKCMVTSPSLEERTQGVRLFLRMFSDPMYVPDAEVRTAHEEVLAHGPQCFWGNPWYMMTMMARFEALGLPLPDSVEGILFEGEYVPAPIRGYVRRQFGLRPFDIYETCGVPLVAMSCPLGRYHVANHCHLEFLRDGREVPEGEVGEVVLTTLSQRAMPLLRYRTGDLARKGGACPCGHPAPTFEALHRLTDCLALGERVVPMVEIDRELGGIEDLLYYRLFQHPDEAVSAECGVVPSRLGQEENVVAAVREVVRARGFAVDRVSVRRISPRPSKKFGPLVSKVARLPQRVAQAYELEKHAAHITL